MPPIVELLLPSACVLLSAAWIAAQVFPRRTLEALLLFICLVLAQITVTGLLLGILHELYPQSLVILAPIVSLGLAGLTHPKLSPWWTCRSDRSHSGDLNEAAAAFAPREVALLGAIGAMALLPMRSLLQAWIQQIHQVHPLSWDVVSFHLPNVLSYMSQGNLWRVYHIYGEYPGGNELLNLWSMMPLRTDAALGLTTASLGLACVLASVQVLQAVGTPRSRLFSGMTILLLVTGLLHFPEIQEIFFDIGRNDLPVMFWELIALWMLLQAVRPRSMTWQMDAPQWLLGVGLSLGLLIGTKPNGLFYLIGMVGLVVGLPWHPFSWRNRCKLAITHLLLPTIGLGGFWYFRNLLRTGHLSPSEHLQTNLDLSILWNLFNPALYAWNPPFVIFLGSVGMTIAMLVAGLLRPTRFPVGIKLVALWNAIALLALVLTPSSAGYFVGDDRVFWIQLRYSAIVFPLTLILVIWLGGQILDQVASQVRVQTPVAIPANSIDGSLQAPSPRSAMPTPYPPLRKTSRLWLGGVSLSILMMSLLQGLTYHPPNGLPGYDGIFFPAGRQTSDVYDWVQHHLDHATLYSVGLRPYGLYGYPYHNQVVSFRLESEGWTLREGLQVIRQQQPQYLAISLDPFTHKAPPGIVEVAKYPQIFQLVYQDPLAAVFRITDRVKSLSASP